MNLLENDEMLEISARLKESMIDFIAEGVTYSEKEVDQCMLALHDFLKNMSHTKNKEEGMKLVEKTVLALNELSENYPEMIETGQREDICEIIILAGFLMRYNGRDEDITEEWREW
jgi:hypothetical protein